MLGLTYHLPWEVSVEWKWRPYLPARLTELLDVDGAAEGDDEQGEALGRQTVVADHGIQHLQRHLGGGERVKPALPPACRDGTPPPLPTDDPLASDDRPPFAKVALLGPSESVSVWEALLHPSHSGSSRHKP